MDDKVYKSTQNNIVKLLNHCGDSESVGRFLDENNLLEGTKSELSENQNKVLSTFPEEKTVKLMDMWVNFDCRYSDTLSRSGHYRVVQQLIEKDMIMKVKSGCYKRHSKQEIINNILMS